MNHVLNMFEEVKIPVYIKTSLQVQIAKHLVF